MHIKLKQFDKKEIELPETVFIRDIESRVFQSLIVQSLSSIEGVHLPHAKLLDNLLGRDSLERVTGIHVEQDLKNHSVNIKVEINIEYGFSIPKKAEEVQVKIAQDISKWTSLHVGVVHVIFKNLVMSDAASPAPTESEPSTYSDEF